MPRNYPRSARVSEWLLQEISDLLLREVSDPRLKLVSCTAVHLSPDMSHAKVFFCSARTSENEIKETVAGLGKASSFLRHALAKRLHMRSVPMLHFVHDVSAERADHLSRLIKEANDTDAPAFNDINNAN